MLLRIVSCAFALCLALTAQQCPDLELDRIDQRVTVGPTVDCNTLQYRWRGIQLGNGVAGCPTFVIIEPGYDSTRHRAGCNTYAVPVGRMPVTRLSFACDIRYLLFIPLSTTCTLLSAQVIGHRSHYEFHPCALLPVGQAPVLQGE